MTVQARTEPQSTARAARRELKWTLAAAVLYNLAGVATIESYLTLVYGWAFLTTQLGLRIALVVCIAALGLSLAYWWVRPVFGWLRGAARGEAEPAAERVQRIALNMPVLLAMLALAGWLVAGVILAGGLILHGGHDPVRLFVHLSMANLYAGQLVAIFSFGTAEALLERHVWPLVMRERRASDVPGVVPVPIWLRLGLLLLTTALGPMLYLYLLYLLGDAGGGVLLFVIGVSAVNALWQGRFILRAVSLPIGRIAGRFDRFRRGETAPEPLGIYRADALGRFAEMFEDLLGTVEERDFIRRTFGRYVSQQVLDEILGGRVELGGTRLEATVLFADIRQFTTMAEGREPERVVRFLNEYLDEMVQAITSHHGIPDKFIGDGILAAWGVPVPQPGHAEDAVRAGLAMLDALAGLNARWRAQGEPEVRIGMGIHSGELIAGNIGSAYKMEFTVVGDTVNTCSRLEGLSKEYGSPIVISEAVRGRLPAELAGRFEAAGTAQVRGRQAGVSVYCLPVTRPETQGERT